MDLNLQGKILLQTNITEVTKDIEAKLKGVKTSINLFSTTSVERIKTAATKLMQIHQLLVKIDPLAMQVAKHFKEMSEAFVSAGKGFKVVAVESKKTSAEVVNTVREVKQAESVLAQFGSQAALAAKRYTAFTLAVGAGYSIINKVKGAVKESIEFQDRLVKMSQISGKTYTDLKPLVGQISKLSTEWGVSSEKLSNVSITLLQAGLTSRETTKALEALAKVDLAPSFGNIEQAAEAAIAIMHQFGTSTDDLKRQFSSINAVSAEFAVESEDLVKAIQRAGAAYGQLAKESKNPKDALNEFISLFTSVRQTTRESSETIATGLRTIFTRIQRPKTLEFFDTLGIKLTETKNGIQQFIGIYPAIERISKAIEGVPFTDPRMASIAEELGGFRQINKSIPLITQFATAQEALNVAKSNQNQLDEIAIQSQDSLARKIAKVEESFLALFRSIGETNTFQSVANGFLTMAQGAIDLVSALKPLIPLLTVMATIKITEGAKTFVPAFYNRLMSGTHHVNESNRLITDPFRRASGGYVPGSGMGDTVPAMLTPKEYVIQAPAARKLGPSVLHHLNNVHKYATGGWVGLNKGGSALGNIGFNPEQRGSGSKDYFTLTKAMAYFAKQIELLSGPVADVAKDFKIVHDETANKRGGGIVNLSSKKATVELGSKATMGTVAHEFGHVLELSMMKAMKLQQLPSNIKGTYANKVAQEFLPARLAELKKSGASAESVKYHTQGHELFATAFSRMSPEQQKIVAYKTQHDPFLANNPNSRIPLADDYSLNPNWSPSGTSGPTMSIAEGYAIQKQKVQRKKLGLFSGFRGSGGNLHSGFLRLGQGVGQKFSESYSPLMNQISQANSILSGNAPLPTSFRGNVAGRIGRSLSTQGTQISAGVLAALASSKYGFGTVSTNTKEHRQQGMVGDVTSGTLGGLAAGGAAGSVFGPLGGAIGAVVGALGGFVLSLESAKKEVASLDFKEAIEDALDNKGFENGPQSGKILAQLNKSSTDAATFMNSGAGLNIYEKNSNFQEGVLEKNRQIRQNRGEFVKGHMKELQEILTPEIKNVAGKHKTFQSFAQSKEGQEIIKRSQNIFGEQMTGGNLFKFIRKAGGYTKDARMDVIHDALDTDVTKFRELADAISSAIDATKGFGHAADLAIAGMGGGTGTLNLVDRSNLLSNPNKLTFGQTSSELDSMLGNESGGAKFSLYAQAHMKDFAQNVKNSLTLSGGEDASLSTSFEKIKKDFISEYGGGPDVERMAGNILQVIHQRAAGNDLKGKSVEEIANVIGKPNEELAKALADLRKNLTDAGNDFINTFAKTTEALNNLDRERFGAANLGISATNKEMELNGGGISVTNQDAFRNLQRNLAKRGGVGPNDYFSASHIAQDLEDTEAKKRELAKNGGTPEQIADLNMKSQALVAALNNLKSSVEQNTLIEKQLADLNQKRDAGLSLDARFRGGSIQDRQQIIRGLTLTSALNQGGLDINSLSKDDFNLLHSTVNDMKSILPGIEDKLKDAQIKAGGFNALTAGEDIMRIEDKKNIVGNIRASQDATVAGIGVQDAQIKAAQDEAKKRFEVINSTMLDKFNDTFAKNVAMLSEIPREFQLKGQHEIQVTINGAEAFAKMQPAFEEFVKVRIEEGIQNLTNKLKAKNPGPGLPIS